MKISSEIISTNLLLLEKAKEDFPLLVNYENSHDISEMYDIKKEAIDFGLGLYIEFIEFIKNMKSKDQEIFYRRKIKNSEFQKILCNNAVDEDAIKSFKSKAAKSFESLINSEKWEILSGNGYKKRSLQKKFYRRWTDNFSGSEAIISNFIIQNQLEIKDEFLNRICKWYWMELPKLDFTIQNEINQTKKLISYLISKLDDSGIDFRRLNFTHLTSQLNDEIKKKILTIDNEEKIKLISNDTILSGFTYGKFYMVLNKQLYASEVGGGSLLMVNVKNDMENKVWVKYSYFETVSNLRNSALDYLLNN